MTDVQFVYDKLSSGSFEIRSEGIQLAERVQNLSLLIMPPAGPRVWECCAQVLSTKSDSVLAPYLKDLLKWLQDLNWPGAADVLARLKVFSAERLKTPFIECFNTALETNGFEGAKWIYNMSELLENAQFRKVLPQEIAKKYKCFN